MLAARSVSPERWLSETAAFLGEGEMAEASAGGGGRPDGGLAESPWPPWAPAWRRQRAWSAGFLAASRTDSFADAVFAAANAGGASDTVGAIAGALAGAYGGDTSVPQPLIDGLGSRIYVSLAAPWFYPHRPAAGGAIHRPPARAAVTTD